MRVKIAFRFASGTADHTDKNGTFSIWWSSNRQRLTTLGIWSNVDKINSQVSGYNAENYCFSRLLIQFRKKFVVGSCSRKEASLSRSVRRRAMRIINNTAIDPGTRAIIRYSLGINDPWTPSLVRRAEAGEVFDENFSLRPVKELSIEYDSNEVQLDQTIDEKLEALTDLICRPGNEPDIKSAALLLLMTTLEKSAYPKSLATTTKNFAFLRCCELNLYGMVDAQTEVVERELLRP